MAIKCENLESFIMMVKQKKIYIYGAGFVAERFFSSLKKIGLENRIISFITTELSQRSFLGFNVLTLDDVSEIISDDEVVCIAAHESIYIQICNVLEQRGIKEYIWIYPFLHDLYYGNPIKRNVYIKTSDILKNHFDEFAIPIRYLVIEQYYGLNDMGFEIYLKGMKMHCSEETSKIRLSRFVELIKRWEKYGYDESCCIKITDKGQIVDGLHRFSLAVYHDLSKIKCDIYHNKENEHYSSSDVYISNQKKQVFSKQEVLQIERVIGIMKNKEW